MIRILSVLLLGVHSGHSENPLIIALTKAIDDRKWELSESFSRRYVAELNLDTYDHVQGTFKLDTKFELKPSRINHDVQESK